MYLKPHRNSKEREPLYWGQSLKHTFQNSFVWLTFDSYLLTRHRAHQLWLSLILPKILFLPVKILQRFQDTLYNPVKLFSTAPEFQLSPVSLTDKIRHLDRAHASLARCLVFVHCIRALDAARLISRNELWRKGHSTVNPAPQHEQDIKFYLTSEIYRLDLHS